MDQNITDISNEFAQLFSFTTFVQALKEMERFKGQYYWKDYPTLNRYESVADHTWRLVLLIILFEKKLSQSINLEKALKMAIIHDIPEIVAGDESPMGLDGTGKDTHAYNAKKQEIRHENETSAAKYIFDKLPTELSVEFYNLWLEYESLGSFEARIVKALDKIECMLQVLEYRKGELFKEHLEFTISYAIKNANIDPAINKFGEFIAGKLRESFVEYKLN